MKMNFLKAPEVVRGKEYKMSSIMVMMNVINVGYLRHPFNYGENEYQMDQSKQV